MKKGIAKFDAGIPLTKGFQCEDGQTKEIKKGAIWLLPDWYDFEKPNAIFEPVQEKKRAKTEK